MNEKIGEYFVRNFRMEDVPTLVQNANNRNIWLNLRDAFPHPYTAQDAKSFITHITESSPQTIFAISTKTDVIGCIGLTIGEDVHRLTAELGYWLAEAFWGKGIMTNAVKTVIMHAINRLNLIRIYAEPFINNPASVRILEKSGFIQEGILRSNVYKDGKVLDQYLYSYVKT